MIFTCSVKPAIFDLFLAFAIAIYLAFVYLIVNVVSLLCVCVSVCLSVCISMYLCGSNLIIVRPQFLMMYSACQLGDHEAYYII